MDIGLIRELVGIAKESGLSELSVQDSSIRVTVRVAESVRSNTIDEPQRVAPVVGRVDDGRDAVGAVVSDDAPCEADGDVVTQSASGEEPVSVARGAAGDDAGGELQDDVGDELRGDASGGSSQGHPVSGSSQVAGEMTPIVVGRDEAPEWESSGEGALPSREGASVDDPDITHEMQPIAIDGEDVMEEGQALADDEWQAGWKLVSSPLVGTYREASEPGSAPYVKIGQEVVEGQVLCAIEAMGSLTEVKAEESGLLRKACLQDGESVQYGTPLFYIETRGKHVRVPEVF